MIERVDCTVPRLAKSPEGSTLPKKEIAWISDTFEFLLLQPATLCNADCEYCYLPYRGENNLMSLDVASAVSNSIREQSSGRVVEIFWHGGEPLVTPIAHFRKLLGCFETLRQEGRVSHSLQTNATLINDDWCSLFKEFDVSVGVSLDGPPDINTQRVDWAGRPIYDLIMRGIQLLRKDSIPFSVIAVVNGRSIELGKQLYDFFATLGYSYLAINIEEVEGVNLGTSQYLDDDRVKTFWSDLYEAWKDNPVIGVREIVAALKHIAGIVGAGSPHKVNPQPMDPFPVVDYNGDVVLLSPGFSGVQPVGYDTFVVGNVLQQSLPELVRKRWGYDYVNDYVRGVERCAQECAYFDFCGGGYAGSKYFGSGTTDATETAACRNTRQRLIDAIGESILKEKGGE